MKYLSLAVTKKTNNLDTVVETRTNKATKVPEQHRDGRRKWIFHNRRQEGRIEDDISETKYNDDNSTLMRSSTGEDDINESNALSERITIGLSENKNWR